MQSECRIKLDKVEIKEALIKFALEKIDLNTPYSYEDIDMEIIQDVGGLRAILNVFPGRTSRGE